MWSHLKTTDHNGITQKKLKKQTNKQANEQGKNAFSN